MVFSNIAIRKTGQCCTLNRMNEREPLDTGQPLFDVLRRIRKPTTLREIMALCLRHVLMGDPFADTDNATVPIPETKYLEKVDVSEADIAGNRCVIYRPKVLAKEELPVMFYMHGGGFVTGCSEDTDYTTRRLSLDNNLVVISINYPLAPEAVFPKALDACNDVIKKVCDEKSSWQVDRERVFLCGDSAGGNLAVALAAQLNSFNKPASGLILLAPWLDMEVEKYDSYNLLAPKGIVYDAAFTGYARGAYVTYKDWKNPMASPIHCSPDSLPPTIILVGTDDPILDQSVVFHAKVSGSGIPVRLLTYEGMPHCFYSFPGLFSEEIECYQQISNFISSQSN